MIFIHSSIASLGGLTGEVSTAIIGVARLAVPFFFAVSGYFLYAATFKDQTRKASKSIIKLINLFLLGSLLYFVYALFKGATVAELLGSISPEGIFSLIVFNNPIFGGILWFILGLIGATGIHWLHARFIKKDWILVLVASLLFIFGLLYGGNYGDVLGLSGNSNFSRNFFTFGVMFTTIGYLVAKNKQYLLKLPFSTLLKLSFVATILYFIEYYAVFNHVATPKDAYLFAPLMIVCILAWCIKFPNLLSSTKIPAIAAYVTLYIYILHPIILDELWRVYLKLGLDVYNPFVASSRIVLTFAICLGVGMLYYYLVTRAKEMRGRFQIVYNSKHVK